MGEVAVVALFGCALLIVLIKLFLLKKKGDTMSDKYNQDGSISRQWIAEEISRREGKAEEVNIAQIKETLHVTLDILRGLQNEDADKFEELMAKHG